MKIGHNSSLAFPIMKGIVQGCCLSPSRVYVFIEQSLEEMEENAAYRCKECGRLSTLQYAQGRI